MKALHLIPFLLRLTLLVSLWQGSSYALPPNFWQYQQNITLKKDKFFTAEIQKKDIITKASINKIFYFRWTLYINDILTMHLHLDGFNHQFTLQLKPAQNSYRVMLSDKKLPRILQDSYLWLELLTFDNEQATFSLSLRNPSKDIVVIRK